MKTLKWIIAAALIGTLAMGRMKAFKWVAGVVIVLALAMRYFSFAWQKGANGEKVTFWQDIQQRGFWDPITH